MILKQAATHPSLVSLEKLDKASRAIANEVRRAAAAGAWGQQYR